MFPGKINPRQLQQAMKRMNIQQEEIDATEVIIKTPERDIVITEPSVSKVNMMGQETFQISGEIHEREKAAEIEISQDDIKTVMEQANVDEAAAKSALEKAKGDIAAAVMELQK